MWIMKRGHNDNPSSDYRSTLHHVKKREKPEMTNLAEDVGPERVHNDNPSSDYGPTLHHVKKRRKSEVSG